MRSAEGAAQEVAAAQEGARRRKWGVCRNARSTFGGPCCLLADGRARLRIREFKIISNPRDVCSTRLTVTDPDPRIVRAVRVCAVRARNPPPGRSQHSSAEGLVALAALAAGGAPAAALAVVCAAG